MKIQLAILPGILFLSLTIFAQKTTTPKATGAPAQALSIKDLEIVLTGYGNIKTVLAGKGFKMKETRDKEDYNEDTVVTSNGKGDEVLMIYSYQRMTSVLFKTSSFSTAKKILTGAARHYQLKDSVELVKGNRQERYLQKRFAYIEQSAATTSTGTPPPGTYRDPRFLFSFTDPVMKNGKKQYVIHFRQIKDQENSISSVEMPNRPDRPITVSEMEYAHFLADSISVERYIHPTSIHPIAPGLLSRMNEFILQQLFKDQYLPLQFLHFSNVQSILISPDNEEQRSLEYQFNTAGQLSAVSFVKQVPDEKMDWGNYNPFDDEDIRFVTISPDEPVKFGFDTRKYPIEYQQTVPVKAGNISLDYHMDTIIAYTPTWLRVYKMVNKTFFLIEEYHLSKESYRKKDLRQGKVFTLEEKDGKVYHSCYLRNEDRSGFNRCYSNTNWELPFTIMDYHPRRETYSIPFESYQESQPGQLLKETKKDGRLTWYISNYQLKALTNCKVMYKQY